MIKLVIFDLDGTLVNSIADIAGAVNAVLEQENYPKHPLSAFNYFVGNGAETLMKRALPQDTHTDEVERMTELFKRYYTIHANENTQIYDGVTSLLEVLKERGIKTAVASNKYHSAAVEVVRNYFEERLFDIVEGKRDGIMPKPDPTVVHNILASIGIKHHEALYVGDSGVDMQTAQNANIESIGVLWGYRSRKELEENGATHIISDPYNVLAIIDNR